MNVYVLDYSGTLDQDPDPNGLIRALRARGGYVILFSGFSPREIDKDHPGLVEAATAFVAKGNLLALFDAIPTEADTVVFVDDDHALGRSLLRAGQDTYPARTWKFIPAKEIRTLC